jgi:erythrin-vacuolar iron transport family protein
MDRVDITAAEPAASTTAQATNVFAIGFGDTVYTLEAAAGQTAITLSSPQNTPGARPEFNQLVDVAAGTARDSRGMATQQLTLIKDPWPVDAPSVDTVPSRLSAAVARAASDLLERWRQQGRQAQILRFVQPALIGLIDGTISTLAPIFATAFLAGSRAALLVGLASSLGAAISMGLSEALSDDGEVSGRGRPLVRGALTGIATFVGGTLHALPFLIDDTHTALNVAYVVVSMELVGIAWVRRRFLRVPLHLSLVQVTLGGCVVAVVGALIGHA